VVVSSPGTGRDSRGISVRTTGSPLLQLSSVDIEDALVHETSALDIALASGCEGAINIGIVHGLLIECLPDVSSSILAMLYLVALLLGFLFFYMYARL
jgi:hypothetical protein